MKITRARTNKDNLSIATWKYWVVALYEERTPVRLLVVPTSQISYEIAIQQGYDEFRLIQGFPIKRHAEKFLEKKNKTIGAKKFNDLYKPAKEMAVPAGQPAQKRRGKECKDCQKENLKKPFTVRCSECCSKYVTGNRNGQCVYGLYNGNNELVYVGVTNNPVARVHDHLISKKFKKMRVIRNFDTRPEADEFEKNSIYTLQPPLNILILKATRLDAEEMAAFGKVSEQKRKFRARTEVPLARTKKK
jgi:hypothetical protein